MILSIATFESDLWVSIVEQGLVPLLETIINGIIDKYKLIEIFPIDTTN